MVNKYDDDDDDDDILSVHGAHTLVVCGGLGAVHVVELLERLFTRQLGVGLPLPQRRLARSHLVGEGARRASLVVELGHLAALVVVGAAQSQCHRVLAALLASATRRLPLRYTPHTSRLKRLE